MTVSRRFGAYDVTIFIDGVYKAPVAHLAHAQSDARRDAAVEAWGRPTVDMDVNFFALAGPDGLMLVDAGTGPFWGPGLGHGRTAMAQAGIAPADVRRVLLTHLHGDHALGLFEETEPFFPEAEIFVPAVDLAFFTDLAAKETVPAIRRGGFDIAARLLDLYGDRVTRIGEGPVLPEIEAIAMPGHTPGHSGYLVGTGPERLVLWGDLFHTPDLQLADPDICFIYDADAALGAHSRRAILRRAAREGWSASGGHVSGFVRVEPAGETFRFVPV
ncbi:MBL fold metallo-hydrolase [Rhizobiaceae bacterium BDR2-2]|uniref:MBL fold metallo-hydrolase n=1 Tax=Ectorhizobium quercum TaxID=2965071 RepID=A0AAE3SUH7_9HYPH|nr:MBL fold metallo-hydrolase [Ectorhizobium quercum]MCX8996683.1 MBL fold metallo-hydrolase [Ectorhizobium quercum]